MRLPLRSRDRDLGVLRDQRLAETRDEITGQKGTVTRSAEDPRRVRPVRGGPIERGEDSCERSWEVLHAVGDDRQPERCEALGIAIGVDGQAFALRLEPGDDAGEDRAAADFAQGLVAAAHPAR